MTLAVLVALAACCSNRHNPSQEDAPPQCARPQPVEQRTYIVFFDQHSSAVTGRGTAIVREFMDRIKIFTDVDILIYANKDSSEVTYADRTLNLHRAEAVAALMRHMGLPPNARISIAARGTTAPMVPTPALKAEPQNRGVVLSARGGRQILPNDVQRACIGWLQTHDCGADVSDQQRATCDKVRAVVGVFGR